MDRSREFREVLVQAQRHGQASSPSAKARLLRQHQEGAREMIQPILKDSIGILGDLQAIHRLIESKRTAFGKQKRLQRTCQADRQFEAESDGAISRCLQRLGQLDREVGAFEEAQGRTSSTGAFGWLLGSGRSEEAASQLGQHLRAIVLYLQHRCSEATKAAEDLKEGYAEQERAQREREDRHKLLLASTKAKAPTTAAASSTKTVMEDEQAFATKHQISGEQMQLLRQENDAILRELTETQTAILQTERSVNEIARLSATLQETLLFQEAMVERLHEDAEGHIEMVQKGNALLRRAASNQSSFRNVLVVLIVVMTSIILFLHHYSA